MNRQAQTELGLTASELAEMGSAALVPARWQICTKTPQEVARWYQENFSQLVSGSAEGPEWYPLGFIALIFNGWRETGFILVYLDAWPQHPENAPVPVKAFVVDGEKIRSAVIILRQGDDDYENVKRYNQIQFSV